MNAAIAFVTYRERPGLTPDDALAASALREVTGLEVVAVPWDLPGVAWEDFAAVVPRSTWDYFHRPEEFKRWLDGLEAAGARVFNPLALARWNMEKTYLRGLVAAGVPIVPTFWAERGRRVDLPQILAERGWRKAVVKPTISGSAHETWVTSPQGAASAAEQTRVERLSAVSGIMVQPFLEEIVESGEWSIIFLDGEYSHAIVKTPAAGDFRVQEQFGASRQARQPAAGLLREAREVLEATATITGQMTRPLYARVDGVQAKGDGRFLLMELELIEPVLSFAVDPLNAPQRFAQALARRLELPLKEMNTAPANLWPLGAALLPFAVSTSVTPGPNNLMVTASALNFGFRRTLPHMTGISLGFPLMLLAVGLGLGRILAGYPSLHRALTILGAGYLLFLAWKIATAAPVPRGSEAPPTPRPITFLQAALFQWVNPKAWIMALGAVTTYTRADASLPLQVLLIAAIFAVVAFPSVSLWALCGHALTHALVSSRARRAFNYTMAGLLVASLVFLFL